MLFLRYVYYVRQLCLGTLFENYARTFGQHVRKNMIFLKCVWCCVVKFMWIPLLVMRCLNVHWTSSFSDPILVSYVQKTVKIRSFAEVSLESLSWEPRGPPRPCHPPAKKLDKRSCPVWWQGTLPWGKDMCCNPADHSWSTLPESECL